VVDRFGDPDALDRRVEEYSGSAYSEIVYGPAGNKMALMSGQTVTKIFTPLSGGATAVYNSSGLAYYRHPDWLGSSRVGFCCSFEQAMRSFDQANCPLWIICISSMPMITRRAL
jgi:hypothetical protein